MSAQVITSPRLSTHKPEAPGDAALYRASLLAALAYADLFDYPLTLQELARYQAGTHLTAEDIRHLLLSDPELHRTTACVGDYYCLRGRESTIAVRLRRKSLSAEMWPKAHTWGKWLARMPFVRMVAVTGSLAVDNVSGNPDIDYMVVAEPGRIWVCRRLLIMCVRLARLMGDQVCPNFVLSANRLALGQHDFFTAHELAQMVPISGFDMYEQFLLANLWALHYLPCGLPISPAESVQAPVRGRARLLAERLLKRHLFDRWERWEMLRLRAHLRALAPGESEIICSPEQCKGHTSLHRETTMSRYAARLNNLGLLDTFAHLFADDDSTRKHAAERIAS